MRARKLHPEILDELPAQDARAQRSRRDLRRVNAWMGNSRHIADQLQIAAQRRPPQRVVDLGSGDGYLLLRCLNRLSGLPEGLEVLLVDCQRAADPAVLASLQARNFVPRVIEAEAARWLQQMPVGPNTWVLANLFLHHFSEEILRRILSTLADKTHLCCACEPHRDRWSLIAARLLWMIGAGPVTCHDAKVSVRAGFRPRELSALWPSGSGWSTFERRAGWFSHLFLAQRR